MRANATGAGLREHPTIETACAALGLSFIWGLYRAAPYLSVFSNALSAGECLALFYAPMLIASIVGAGVVYFQPRIAAGLLLRQRVILPLCIGASLSQLTILVGPDGLALYVAVVVSVVLCGTCNILLFILAGKALAAQEKHKALYSIAVSFVLYSVLLALEIALNLQAAGAILAPFASCLFLLASVNTQTAEAPRATEGAVACHAPRWAIAPLPLLACASTILARFLSTSIPGAITSQEMLVTAVASLGFSLAVIVLTRLDSTRLYSSVLVCSTLMFVAALFCVIALTAIGLPIGVGIMTASFRAIQVFGLLVFVEATHREGCFSVKMMVMYVCLFQLLPAVLSDCGAALLNRSVNLSETIWAIPVVSLVAFVVISLCMVFLERKAVHQPNESEAGDEKAQRTEACRSLANRLNLTNREREVLDLLSQGHTVKKIAERLCLAPSTVQGYTRTLYAKAGVHSRQEIIDLVDAEMPS